MAGDPNTSRARVKSGSQQTRVSVTPGGSTDAYTSGDSYGGASTFSNMAPHTGGSGTLTSATVVINSSAFTPDWDLLVFDRTVTSQADNAAQYLSDSDMANLSGVIKVRSGDYITSLSTNGAGYVETNVPFVCPSSARDLVIAPVIRTATTFTATNQVVFILTADQD